MVDVGHKRPQQRRALARGEIRVSPEVVRLIKENQMKKGDVLTVAQIAGVQAAKQTSQLIPLCHPLMVDRVDVQLSLGTDRVVAQSEVRCVGRTGVEMEALTAVSVALLTVYDMAKAVDREMEIGPIRLLEKEKRDE
jgi:cyclic pyranopterin phosphate synthase